MKRTLLCCALLWGMSYSLWAQSISGTVLDAATGDPLAGVAVLIKGTTSGSYTDAEGKYQMDLIDGATTLQFSFVGFQTVEMLIGEQTTIDVELAEDILELDAVVVTGFSTVRKKDVTGSISSIGADAIESQPVITMQNALQGRAAGVQVTNNSGTPGGGIDVRVRGSTSITADNQPLYVVDGVPVIAGDFSQNGVGNAGTNALADINPNDIESIEVLKDASTAAIYGSRGANGVVLITTKRGKSGRTKVTFDATYGIQEAWNTVPVLDTAGYFAILDEQTTAAFGVPASALGLGRVSSNGGDNFWQDEIFRTGSVTDNTLSISGGSEKTQFFSSISYYQNEGIVRSSEFDRYSGRLNVEHRANDKFKMGMNMNFVHSNAQRVQNDNNIFGAVSAAILLPPDVRIKREDGSFDTKFGLENPVAAVSDYQNNAITNRIISNIFGEYEFLDGLSLRVNAGVDLVSFREEVYEPVTLQSGAGSNGSGFVGQVTSMRWLTDYTLNYLKAFGKSNIAVVAGVGFQQDTRERSDITRVGFPSPDFTTLDAASETTGASADFTRNSLNSYFANVNYSFDDRYILTGTFRADGYSAFAENNQFGYFPGVSGAWRLSSESFMQSVNFVNDLKVRVGWGITGNNNIGDFDALALSEAGSNYLDLPGTTPSQLGNPELQWETTTQLNIGLDYTLVNSRISGSIDYFIKNTEDLLLDRPLPTTSGFTVVTENIGEVENRGLEF
ncbi:MAG: SusC/RagA family TonB-linked outer membrane protein, partial [Bacteroidota bacterium]